MNTTEKEEQNVCVSCGFCCDRTLFDVARLRENEVLFDKFIPLGTTIDNKRFFELPCPYFLSKCTIYDQEKPHVCSKFKCNVLKEMAKGDISTQEALNLVEKAKILRDEVVDAYFLKTTEKIPFREIFVRSFKNKEFETDEDLKLIKMKAIMLDILLSKHFKGDAQLEEYYEIIE